MHARENSHGKGNCNLISAPEGNSFVFSRLSMFPKTKSTRETLRFEWKQNYECFNLLYGEERKININIRITIRPITYLLHVRD